MSIFNFKQISDPIYKTIGLSEIEIQVIDTPVFQRLRNVKHLGLVSLVYPGADFSRFDHSLGVCHVTGQILSALKESNADITDEEIQDYRLAALLHDIGHYPFSHPMENAIKNYYQKSYVVSKEAKGKPAEEENGEEEDGEQSFLGHEHVGRKILELDKDLENVIAEKEKREKISNIFTGVESSRFSNLVKSDLDADRVDYLLRTAHHTGVPYGSVDVSYLLSQMVLDPQRRIAVQEKALRAAEHLLLCRYFVYQQNIFHKTVAGFEYLLGDISGALLENGIADFSRKKIEEAIIDQSWRNYDDNFLISKIGELEDLADDWIKLKVKSIRLRRPPSLVAEWERLDNRDVDTKNDFDTKIRLINEKLKDIKKKYEGDIHESLWNVWRMSRALTNLGSRTGISDPVSEEEKENSIWLYDPKMGKSGTIMENSRSLMSVMSNKALYSIRIYVLLPEEKKNLRADIRSTIKEELPTIFSD